MNNQNDNFCHVENQEKYSHSNFESESTAFKKAGKNLFFGSLLDTAAAFLGLFLSVQIYGLVMALFSHSDGFFKTYTQNYFLPVIHWIVEYRYMILIIVIVYLIKNHYLKIKYAMDRKVKNELTFYILAGLMVELLFVFFSVIAIGRVIASVHQIPFAEYFQQLADRKNMLYLLVFSFPVYFIPSVIANALLIAAGILKKNKCSFTAADRKPAFLLAIAMPAVFIIYTLISHFSFNWIKLLHQFLFVSKPAI